MKKGFIALALAASVALTGFAATPARADGEDIAKVLLGLVVIGAIANAIDKDDPAPEPVTRRDPRPDHRLLPRACLRPFETRHGTRYGFGERCIENRVGRINLPERCERRGENRRGRMRTFYAEHCMARRGYRVAG